MFGQVFLLSYTKYSLLYNLSHQFIAVKPRLITLRSSLYGTQTTWVINRGFPTIISVVIYIFIMCILVLLYSFGLNTKMQKIFQFCFRRFSDISVLDDLQTTGPLSSPRTVCDRDGSRGRLENLAKDN